MAIFHVATNTPPKSELIAGWIHVQPWGPAAGGPVEMLGGFHLDDPAGEVGMLGPRFVYDGLTDERFMTVLAGVAMHGYGQALGFAEHDGRWHSWPEKIIVQGHGTVTTRLAVDGFTAQVGQDATVLTNDQIELTVFRRLVDRPAPEIGLSASWQGQSSPQPLVAARLLNE